jgi:hypothetical protein
VKTKITQEYLFVNGETGKKKVYKHFSFMCKDNGIDKESTVRYQVNNNGFYATQQIRIEPIERVAQSWGSKEKPNFSAVK